MKQTSTLRTKAFVCTLVFAAFLTLRNFLISTPYVNIAHDGDQQPLMQTKTSNTNGPVHYNAHIFYYPWYGNPDHDSRWLHWNHEYLAHWNPTRKNKLDNHPHIPPDDISASFFPSLGAYSSADLNIIHTHFRQLRQSSVGVLVVSWLPPGRADPHGKPLDPLMHTILTIASMYGLHVAFHFEPYVGRTAASVALDIQYIITQYGSHPQLYRQCSPRTPQCVNPPVVVYVYDSYAISTADWAQFLLPTTTTSIRGSVFDALVLGLWVDEQHGRDLAEAGFDGAYTYFASPISHGATPSNWPRMNSFLRDHSMMFVPCIGPGYNDERVRPWNTIATRDRENGAYYTRLFQAVMLLRPLPSFVAITSFNEWHEGTQIEPVSPKTIPEYTYLDYLPNGSSFYLDLTQELASEFYSATQQQATNAQ